MGWDSDGYPSHGLRPYMTVKLKQYVFLGNEMEYIKRSWLIELKTTAESFSNNDENSIICSQIIKNNNSALLGKILLVT